MSSVPCSLHIRFKPSQRLDGQPLNAEDARSLFLCGVAAVIASLRQDDLLLSEPGGVAMAGADRVVVHGAELARVVQACVESMPARYQIEYLDHTKVPGVTLDRLRQVAAEIAATGHAGDEPANDPALN